MIRSTQMPHFRLGHRRIVFLESRHQWLEGIVEHYSAEQRRAGYRETMLAAGLTPRVVQRDYRAYGQPAMVAWGGPEDDRVGVAHALLQEFPRPTAVVSPSAESLGPFGVQPKSAGTAGAPASPSSPHGDTVWVLYCSGAVRPLQVGVEPRIYLRMLAVDDMHLGEP